MNLTINQGSIYLVRKFPIDIELIPVFDLEKRKCEDLIAMGYNNVNGVNLQKRLKELNEKIFALEEKLRRK